MFLGNTKQEKNFFSSLKHFQYKTSNVIQLRRLLDHTQWEADRENVVKISNGFNSMKNGLQLYLFVPASHQTRLDTWSKARSSIKVGMKGRGKSGTSRDSNPAGLCCSSAHLVQCEPDEARGFTNPNLGPGTYASGHVCQWITALSYTDWQEYRI